MSSLPIDEVLERIDAIDVVRQRAHAGLLELPEVSGTAIGFRQVAGEDTDQLAIVVVVERKRDDLREHERVPAEIEGIVADVVVLAGGMSGAPALRDDTEVYRPLVGGVSIGTERRWHGDYHSGTLGCIVLDNLNHAKPMVLSNYHVLWADPSWPVGAPVAQPSRLDDWPWGSHDVAVLARGDETCDCAVATVNDDIACNTTIVGIGEINGQSRATPGEPVRKRGATTGLTWGKVKLVRFTGEADLALRGRTAVEGDVVIEPDVAKNPDFLDHGDSGAVVVNDANQVVALLYSLAPNKLGHASAIQEVVEALNVTIPTGAPGPRVQEELVQAWDHDGALGFTVYSATDTGYAQALKIDKLPGNGSNAKAWMAVDAVGDGFTSIVQLYDYHGHLGITVFSPDLRKWALYQSWSDSRADALAWIEVSFRPPGGASQRGRVVQIWDAGNNKPGVSVFGADSSGTWQRVQHAVLAGSSSAGAQAWLAVAVGAQTGIVEVQSIDTPSQKEHTVVMTAFAPNTAGSYVRTWGPHYLLTSAERTAAWLTVQARGATNILQVHELKGGLAITKYVRRGGAWAWSRTDPVPGNGSAGIWFAGLIMGVNAVFQIWFDGLNPALTTYLEQSDGSYRQDFKGRLPGSVSLPETAALFAVLAGAAGAKPSIHLVQAVATSPLKLQVFVPNAARSYVALGPAQSQPGNGPGAQAWIGANVVVPSIGVS